MRVFVLASFPESLILFRGPLIQALLDLGNEVHVAAPDLPEASQTRLRLEAMGAVVHEVPLKRAGIDPVSDSRFFLSTLQVLKRVRPELFLGYTIKPVIYGLMAAYLARVPSRFALITGLGYTFQGGQARAILRFVVRLLYSVALRSSTGAFFQNPDDEHLFRQLRLLKSTTKSSVLNGSGVDVSAFCVVPIPTRPHFLLIARLLGDKGVREYIAAARLVREKHPNVVFSLVGWIDPNPDSISRSELAQWVEEGVIRYLGRLEDVRPAIADASVYVLPSYREGTPRTVLEAMAMGRPVITTDAPGCRETVTDGLNGYLVPVKSVEPLAIAMLHFVEEPSLAATMGRKSRLIVEEKYDVRAVNRKMLLEMGVV